jgi:hypothetical protein
MRVSFELRDLLIIFAKAASIGVLGDALLSLNYGHIVIRVFPVTFPILLLALLYEQWRNGRKSSGNPNNEEMGSE